MRINRLDLNQLACLDALLVTCSVTRAAQQVHLSQPAVSAALARMREFFGDPLLVPAGRGLSLTPFAGSLRQPVRDLLLQAQALTRRRPELEPKRIERDITIVASDYVQTVLLHALFRRAAREAPGMRFEVRSIGGYLAEELDQGDVDLVVSLASGMSSAHPSEPLFRDSYSCVAWEGNTAVGRTLTSEQYLGLGHVVVVLGRGRTATLDQLALNAQGLNRRAEVRVPNFTLVPGCLVGTNRIATLHTQLARRLARQWPLRILRCPIEIGEIVTAVQWHRHQSHDPAIGWVRRSLHAAVRAERLRPA
ncbi:MAG: LysR family transcriptional regulator [Burkholderiales bacterium]|nr:LysR family transcriptional regulator [Burkholderiales bacterium]